MIFTNKYYRRVQLVHVEADNYFNLITSIDAKMVQQNDFEKNPYIKQSVALYTSML